MKIYNIINIPKGLSQEIECDCREEYNSGYTAGYADGLEACSGESCEGVWEEGYDSGVTDGYESGYTSGRTDGYQDGWQPGYDSGYTDGSEDGFDSGWTGGYDSGYTDGLADCSGETINNQQKDFWLKSANYDFEFSTKYNQYIYKINPSVDVTYDSGYTGLESVNIYGYIPAQEAFDTGYDSGVTDGFDNGYTSGTTDGYNSGVTAGEEAQKAKLTNLEISENDLTNYQNHLDGSFTREDGWNDIFVSIDINPDINSAWTRGYEAGYPSGVTDGYASGYTSGRTDGYQDGWTPGYNSGYTDGVNTCGGDYASGYTDGFEHGYDSGHTDGYNEGYQSGATDGFEDGYDSGATDQKAKLASTAFTTNGTYTRPDGWSAVTVNVPQTGYTQQDLDNAFNSGYTNGYNSGYTDGLEACSGVTPVENAVLHNIYRTDDLNGDFLPSSATVLFQEDVLSAVTEMLIDGSAVTPSYTADFSADAGKGGVRYHNVDITFDGNSIPYGAFSSNTAVHSGAVHLVQTVVSGDCTEIGGVSFWGTNIGTDYSRYPGLIMSDNIVLNSSGDQFGYTELREVDIPTATTKIPEGCFYCCYKLRRVGLHNGITEIGHQAFQQNYALSSITIPASVEAIDFEAFLDCSGLTSVILEGSTPPVLRYTYPEGKRPAFSNTTCTFYVPANAVDTYKAEPTWVDYIDRIQAIQ